MPWSTARQHVCLAPNSWGEALERSRLAARLVLHPESCGALRRGGAAQGGTSASSPRWPLPPTAADERGEEGGMPSMGTWPHQEVQAPLWGPNFGVIRGICHTPSQWLLIWCLEILTPTESGHPASSLHKVMKRHHIWVGLFVLLEHGKKTWCLFSSKPQRTFEEKK